MIMLGHAVNKQHNIGYCSISDTDDSHNTTKNGNDWKCFQYDEAECLDNDKTFTNPFENKRFLSTEVETRPLNLNTQVNQLIKHEDSHSAAIRGQTCYVPKQLITRIFDHLTEEELSNIAQSTAKDLLEINLLLFDDSSILHFLDTTENWLNANQSVHTHKQVDDVYRIFIEHDMG
jgi:hypothetical protein